MLWRSLWVTSGSVAQYGWQLRFELIVPGKNCLHCVSSAFLQRNSVCALRRHFLMSHWRQIFFTLTATNKMVVDTGRLCQLPTVFFARTTLCKTQPLCLQCKVVPLFYLFFYCTVQALLFQLNYLPSACQPCNLNLSFSFSLSFFLLMFAFSISLQSILVFCFCSCLSTVQQQQQLPLCRVAVIVRPFICFLLPVSFCVLFLPSFPIDV